MQRNRKVPRQDPDRTGRNGPVPARRRCWHTWSHCVAVERRPVDDLVGRATALFIASEPFDLAVAVDRKTCRCSIAQAQIFNVQINVVDNQFAIAVMPAQCSAHDGAVFADIVKAQAGKAAVLPLNTPVETPLAALGDRLSGPVAGTTAGQPFARAIASVTSRSAVALSCQPPSLTHLPGSRSL